MAQEIIEVKDKSKTKTTYNSEQYGVLPALKITVFEFDDDVLDFAGKTGATEDVPELKKVLANGGSIIGVIEVDQEHTTAPVFPRTNSNNDADGALEGLCINRIDDDAFGVIQTRNTGYHYLVSKHAIQREYYADVLKSFLGTLARKAAGYDAEELVQLDLMAGERANGIDGLTITLVQTAAKKRLAACGVYV